MPTFALSIVIPAFNEGRRLEAPVRQALRYARKRGLEFELMVVDDGSTDRTSALVESLAAGDKAVRLLGYRDNRGKGHAVRTGVRAARGELILIADADGATPIEQLEHLEAAIAGGADIAIGSRALRGQGNRVERRWYRHLIGRTFHTLVRTLGVRGLRDTQCGFKLFRGSVARSLFSRARIDGFSFDVEVLLLAQRLGHRIAEVPVSWTHQPGSKINLVSDSIRMALDLVLIRARFARERLTSAVVPSEPRRAATDRI